MSSFSESSPDTHTKESEPRESCFVGVDSPRGITLVAFVPAESLEWASNNSIPFEIEVEARKGIGRVPVKGQTEIIGFTPLPEKGVPL